MASCELHINKFDLWALTFNRHKRRLQDAKEDITSGHVITEQEEISYGEKKLNEIFAAHDRNN